MKKTCILLMLLLVGYTSTAKDILILKNQQKFEVKIKKIKDCAVVFKIGRDKYTIPADEIHAIEFENTQDKVYTDYLQRLSTTENLCLKARHDATNFHGKQVGHFFLGVLFGPFAIIGTALANPTPYSSSNTLLLSTNKDYFSSPEYLICYKKRAKGILITMEALGYFSYLMVYLMLSN